MLFRCGMSASAVAACRRTERSDYPQSGVESLFSGSCRLASCASGKLIPIPFISTSTDHTTTPHSDAEDIAPRDTRPTRLTSPASDSPLAGGRTLRCGRPRHTRGHCTPEGSLRFAESSEVQKETLFTTFVRPTTAREKNTHLNVFRVSSCFHSALRMET